MAARRSRPFLIAPLIPLWGILAFFGVEQFAGTRFLAPFLAVMTALFLGLFYYVARRAMEARKLRRRQREMTQ